MKTNIYKLKDLPFDKVFFWSYNIDKAELPLYEIMKCIIEKGDMRDIYMLFEVFSIYDLRDAYSKKIRPVLSGEDAEYYKLRPGAKPDKNSVRLMDLIFKTVFEHVA